MQEYEFSATSYSGFNNCIRGFTESLSTTTTIVQNGADLTLSYKSCPGIIDENNNVELYCEDVDYYGTLDETTGVITGTLEGIMEVSNGTPIQPSTCTSTGTITGTFSLTPR